MGQNFADRLLEKVKSELRAFNYGFLKSSERKGLYCSILALTTITYLNLMRLNKRSSKKGPNSGGQKWHEPGAVNYHMQ